MIEGEYASISEIAAYSPALTPIPITAGQFRDSSIPTYFFLMEFLDIETGAPAPMPFCQQLAEMHADSVSPTGKFGFRMNTCHGPHLQNCAWEDSWSIFFIRLLRQFYEKEIRQNGPTPEGAYEKEFETLAQETIPKILEPLQAEGRILKPSLVHGDLCSSLHYLERCSSSCGFACSRPAATLWATVVWHRMASTKRCCSSFSAIASNSIHIMHSDLNYVCQTSCRA